MAQYRLLSRIENYKSRVRKVNLVRRSDNAYTENFHCTLVRFLRHFNRLVQRHVAHSDRRFLARVFQVMVAEAKKNAVPLLSGTG